MGRIIALGENPHGSHTEQIRHTLSDIKSLDGIFLEESIVYQDSTNQYLRTGKFDKLYERLFKGALKEGKSIKETTKLLLDYAKASGIPVICIDSSKQRTDEYNTKSAHGHYFLKGESRDEDMFDKIAEHYNSNQSWLLVCGSDHLRKGKHHRTGKDTLGERLSGKYGKEFEIIILT